MKPGDVLQVIEPITGSKKNTYALMLDLVRVLSVNHLPVVLVEHFDTKQTFPVNADQLTVELNSKNKAKIKNQNGN
jgi:hypothetical protein